MKTKLFALLSFALFFSQLQAANAARPANISTAAVSCEKGGDVGDIKIVVSQKRIWLIADEMPMKCLKTQIKDAQGNVVLEKCFTSKCNDWFLNIEALPKGEYTFHLGDRVEKFKK